MNMKKTKYTTKDGKPIFEDDQGHALICDGYRMARLGGIPLMGAKFASRFTEDELKS